MDERERGSVFGQLLRRHRLAAGLTQEALAERARVSAQGVSALERGARTTPQRETLDLLADALALGPEERTAFAASAARPSRPRIRDIRITDAPRGVPPVPFTTLHGRDDEVTELADHLRTHRLITLTGPGGIGKTRVAIAAAHAVAERFDDGVRFIELGAITEGLVAHRTAEALGAAANASDLRAAVIAALRSRHTLIVVDTCEHVRDEVAALATAILQAAPGVTLLLTSRQAIGIAGEVVRRIRPLALSFAVELFAARAHAANDAFRLTDDTTAAIATICRRIDAIPLAIELVAPKTALLTPDQIAGMLHDRFRLLAAAGGSGATPERHQTLRAVFDWSHDLLDASERTLFRRLGVFADGWSFERCQAVCHDDVLSAWDIFDALSRLVEKSLVVVDERAGEQRFRFLESTRAYAVERLDRSGETNVVYERLAQRLAADVTAARSLWDHMDDLAWQRTIAFERETIRSVMAWPAATAAAASVRLTLLAALPDPGLVFDRREIRRWYEFAAAFAGSVHDTPLAAAYARGMATICGLDRAPAETVVALSQAAVETSRAAGERAGLVEALRIFGNALREAGRLDESAGAFDEGWALIDVSSSAAATAAFLSDWAMRDLRAGAIESAHTRLERCLAIARPGGIIHANTLATLGELAFSVGDITTARSFATRSVVAFRTLDLGVYRAVACCNAAAYAIADDDFAAAEAAAGEALDVLREIGIAYYVAVALEHVAVLAALRGDDATALPIFAFTRRAFDVAGTQREDTEARGFARAMTRLEQRLGAARLAQSLADCAHVDERRALELASAFRRMETS